MIDIIRIVDGEDLTLLDTDVERAKNILAVQQGNLTYNEDFGIDLEYFLNEQYEFQTESFKSYLIQRLANYGIDVSSVLETAETFVTQFIFNVGSDRSTGGMVR